MATVRDIETDRQTDRDRKTKTEANTQTNRQTDGNVAEGQRKGFIKRQKKENGPASMVCLFSG